VNAVKQFPEVPVGRVQKAHVLDGLGSIDDAQEEPYTIAGSTFLSKHTLDIAPVEPYFIRKEVLPNP
jgi:hypothetical protein